MNNYSIDKSISLLRRRLSDITSSSINLYIIIHFTIFNTNKTKFSIIFHIDSCKIQFHCNISATSAVVANFCFPYTYTENFKVYRENCKSAKNYQQAESSIKLMKVAIKKEEIFLNSITTEYPNTLIDYLIAKGNNVGNKAKGRISKRVFQENKARQIFRKTNISYPLIRTRTPAYQGVRNVPFSENLVCFVFLKHPFWDSSFCFAINDKKLPRNENNSI